MKKAINLSVACFVLIFGGMLIEAQAQGTLTEALAEGTLLEAQARGKEELLFMEIPQVVTASKRPEEINKAPSVVYVVTAEEIKRSGARSLAEILKRVPGMRISLRECSLLGSRGFTSDQNDKFVFLIDGVPITNILQDGTYNFIDIPNLDMVDKIEVVKGPGSTLWGSDASFGVIHIFTKKGEEIGGLKTAFNYATNDDLTVASILYGDKYEDGDYLFSFTLVKSNGFSEFGAGKGSSIYLWDNPDSVDEVNPWVNRLITMVGEDGIRLLDFTPGFELYGKLRLGDTTIKSRASYMGQAYLWETVYGKTVLESLMKHFYTEVEHVDELSAGTTLTTKANVHGLMYERGIPRWAGDVSYKSGIETMTEVGAGAETILNTTLADNHHIVAGAKAMSTFIGPNLRHEYYIASGETTAENDNYKYFITLDPMRDDNIGLYLEDNFDASEKLTLVGGLGLEYNDLRERTVQLMPRAAVIYQLTDALTTKYAYNTGYNRPPAQKKFGKKWGFVEKSEGIEEHDLQLLLNTSNIHATLTGFSYRIKNYFTWGAGPTGDDGHINRGEATSAGIEIDMREQISDKFSLYANYAYADTLINNAKVVGEPQQVYNLGADWYYTRDLSVNLNLNGWVDMYHGTVNNQEVFWSGANEQVVDLSVVADDLYDQPLTLTVYAQNLLNNKVHVGMTGWPGYTYLRGASYGMKVSYKL